MLGWQCRRCGGTEQRIQNGKPRGCLPCNQMWSRERNHIKAKGDAFEEDFPLSPAALSYLAAFDRFLVAHRDGRDALERAGREMRDEFKDLLGEGKRPCSN